ncbi:WD repeat-containing protein 16 [Intoshia linei]|uniref:Cilia- and flagella-associated protein 52 n=1 Tax=Intoshia linei TaxID=1819745 RepID=A0A177BBM2_9BILA|nr:WD repeat-containing protein 16 [Intoshia linei]
MADKVSKLKFGGMIGFNAGIIDGLLIHPNNKYFIYSVGCSVIIESIVEREQTFISKHKNNISCISVSKCGRFIGSGDQTHRGFKSELIIWDFENMNEYYRCETPHQEKMISIDFSPNSSYLATLGGQDDGKIVIWDLEKRIPICGDSAQMDKAGVCNVVKFLNNDDASFVTAGERTIRVWKLHRENRKIKSIDCATGQIKRNIICVEVAHDDSVSYCGSTTGDILIISLNSCKLMSVVPKKNLYTLGVINIKYLKNNYLLIGTNEGVVSLTDQNISKKRASVKLDGGVTSIVLRGAGHQFYVSTGKCSIYKFDLANFKHELIFTSHGHPINDIVFPKDCSRIFATCSFENIRIWDSKKRLELLRINVPNMTCNCLEFSTDGSKIISGWNDGRIRTYYPQSGRKMYTIHNAHISEVTAICIFSYANKLISGSNEGVIRVWQVERMETKRGSMYVDKLLFSLNEHKARVTCIKMRNNNNECVTSSTDGSCIIWNLETQIRIHMIRLNTLFKYVCYTPDEYQIITTGNDRKVGYWETYDASNIREIEASQSGCINGMDICSNGKFFVSGGDDKILKVWDYEEGIMTHYGELHGASITKLKISPDNNTIVSVGEDGSILIWNAPDMSTFSGTTVDQSIETEEKILEDTIENEIISKSNNLEISRDEIKNVPTPLKAKANNDEIKSLKKADSATKCEKIKNIKCSSIC